MNEQQREQMLDELKRAERSAWELNSSDRVEKWRREGEQLEAARAAERENMDGIHRLYAGTQELHREVAQGLGAVTELAGRIVDRIDELEDELSRLRKRLDISEVRHEDLKRSMDARASSRDAEVVALPNPLARRK